MMVITNSKGPQVFKNDAKSTKRPRNNIKKHKLTMFQSVRPLYSIKFNAIATWLWQLSLNSSLRCLNFKSILTSRYYAFSFYILLMLRELIDPTLGLKRNWDHRFMILELGYSKVVRPILLREKHDLLLCFWFEWFWHFVWVRSLADADCLI